MSSLVAASANGHFGVVKTLIGAGANINQADKVGVRVHICIFTFHVVCHWKWSGGTNGTQRKHICIH